MKFNCLLREFRLQNNLTQNELGHILGISGKYISMLENSDKSPSEFVKENLFLLLLDPHFKFSFLNIDYYTSHEVIIWLLNKVPKEKGRFIMESIYKSIKLTTRERDHIAKAP